MNSYYHDLMQLRRVQQLEQMGYYESESADVMTAPSDREVKIGRICPCDPAPRVVIVGREEPSMSCSPEGPSSRDWMLVFLMVFGAAGLTFVVFALVLLLLASLGYVSGGISGGV